MPRIQMRFQKKCLDFLLQISGILEPRIPPFRRSVYKIKRYKIVLSHPEVVAIHKIKTTSSLDLVSAHLSLSLILYYISKTKKWFVSPKVILTKKIKTVIFNRCISFFLCKGFTSWVFQFFANFLYAIDWFTSCKS